MSSTLDNAHLIYYHLYILQLNVIYIHTHTYTHTDIPTDSFRTDCWADICSSILNSNDSLWLKKKALFHGAQHALISALVSAVVLVCITTRCALQCWFM